MRRALIGIFAGIVSCAASAADSVLLSASKQEIEAALAAINADDVMRHIRVLASDQFEGRGPGTRGEDLTVEYLVNEFKRLGLKPGNPDGSFVQQVPFVAARRKGSLSLDIGSVSIDLSEPDDCVVRSTWQVPDIDIQGSEIVFVGHGAVAPEYGWDDFKGADLKGKTLLMLADDPQVPDPDDPTKLDETLFKGRTATVHAMSFHKRDVAAQQGAAATIGIFEPGAFGTPTFTDAISTYGTEGFDTRADDKKLGEPGAYALISPEAVRRLLDAAGRDLAALRRAAQRKDFKPIALNAKASFRVRQTLRQIDSRNVVARVEGTDPLLKNEVVIYTAHWDHFGRNASLQGDQIYNGARDNASGVAAMLEVAKAFAALKTPPRRSILFIATTGEEGGLLGAKYYAEHPLYPLERTLAVLNIDVINVWGPTRSISIVGYGRTTLADDLSRLAQASGRVATDFGRPEMGAFYRSDHFSFAKRGVPAVYMVPGPDYIGKPDDWGRKASTAYFGNDYHKVSDEVKPGWDLSGAVEDYRLYFQLGYQVAQAAQWPEWKAGDEFKAKRDDMLKRLAYPAMRNRAMIAMERNSLRLQLACAVIRRRFSSGCKPHPANAPAGSNRSSHGGNEMAEAFG